jgi:lysophospholipase L1-like esterase
MIMVSSILESCKAADAVRRYPVRLCLAAPVLFAAIGLPLGSVALADHDDHWVAAWGVPPGTTILAPSNQTVREVERISIGGDVLRVRLSNELNMGPITIGDAHIGLAGANGAIVAGSDRTLTFGGEHSIKIAPGAAVYGDPVRLTVPTLGTVAVSLFFPTNTGMATIHILSQNTTYITTGDTTASVNLIGATTSPSRYLLSEIQVLADDNAAAIVTLGDSITEGVTSTTDASHRWPDFLADRLAAAHGIGPRGVDNAGISANRVLNDAAPGGFNGGPGALNRFDRDVLAQAGVKFVILLDGINDIGTPVLLNLPEQAVTADDLITGYRQIIARAHAQGIHVFGGTLTPSGGTTIPGYFTPAGEATREAVNEFIRTSGEFDGVVDFDKAVRDPANPIQLLQAFASPDRLHPNDAGYHAMANAIDLQLFKLDDDHNHD